MQKSLARFTSIGRLTHPAFPTNRAILIFSALATLGAGAWRALSGEGVLVTSIYALMAGFSVYAAWMLARELDPDYDLGAFVAAALALAVLFLERMPNPVAIIWVVQVQRSLNRTTGLQARVTDSLALIAFGAFLSVQASWIYALYTLLALILDATAPPANRRQVPMAGVALVILAAALALLGRLDFSPDWEAGALIFSLGASGLFALLVLPVKLIHSVGDFTGEPLDLRRVRLAGLLSVLVGVTAALWLGWQGVLGLSPLWAALLGTALYRGWRG